VVLVSLRLGRLLLARLCAPLLAAIAAASRRHALAAIHPAVAVPIGAAIAVHGVALMLVVLPALALRHMVPGMAGLTRWRGSSVLPMLAMVLVLRRGRRGLSRSRYGERKRDRTDKNLHLKIS
jgi:hypothetical protein